MEEGTMPKNNNMMVMGAIVALIVLLIAGFFFMSRKSGSNPAVQESAVEEHNETMPTEATETSATQESETVTTVTMEAGSFYYKPNVINAKVGEKIKIVMTSKDMMHDFNIDELGVKLPITKAGTTNEVEFTASKAGTFEFYCSVGQHRKQGQVGTLIVK